METMRNLPKTLQDIPADGLERFWDIMGVKNIFYLHFPSKSLYLSHFEQIHWFWRNNVSKNICDPIMSQKGSSPSAGMPCKVLGGRSRFFRLFNKFFSIFLDYIAKRRSSSLLRRGWCLLQKHFQCSTGVCLFLAAIFLTSLGASVWLQPMLTDRQSANTPVEQPWNRC